jgi:hypothetical protein
MFFCSACSLGIKFTPRSLKILPHHLTAEIQRYIKSMSNHSEIKEWQDFLKQEAFGLTPLQGEFFLAYFGDFNEDEFRKVTRKSVADKVYGDKKRRDGSANIHFKNIYKKFSLWTNEDEKEAISGKRETLYNKKADQLYSFLKQKFQRLSSSSLTHSIVSPAERMNELLMSMNYVAGESQFYTEVSSLDRMMLFFLEISKVITQRWLVNRLIAKNPLLASAYRISVSAETSWRMDDKAIWRSIQNDPGVEDIEKTVTKKLCSQILDKTIILVVFNADRLRTEDIKLILDGFWATLKDEVFKISGQSPKRFLFMLVGEPGWVKDKVLGSVCECIEDIPAIFLPSWISVSSTDIEDWFEPEEVSEFCEVQSKMCRQEFYRVLGFEPARCREPNDPPEIVVDTICRNVLKNEGGIAELEQYWRIAS